MRFYLAGLHAVAADLDLEVLPANEPVISIRQALRQVAGAIQQVLGTGAVRIADERRSGQPGLIAVAEAPVRRADEHFTDFARRAVLQVPIQQQRFCTGNRLADWNKAPLDWRRRQPVEKLGEGGFRGAVQIDQTDAFAKQGDPAVGIGGRQAFAGQQHQLEGRQAVRRKISGQQDAEHRRDAVDQADPFLLDPVRQLRRCGQARSRGDAYGAAAAERSEDITQIHIERRPGQLADARSGAQLELADLPLDEVGQSTDPPHDPLGPTGGTGGEIHVAGIVGQRGHALGLPGTGRGLQNRHRLPGELTGRQPDRVHGNNGAHAMSLHQSGGNRDGRGFQDHPLRPHGAEHVEQAVLRPAGIEGGEDASGLQASQRGNDLLKRIVQQDGNDRALGRAALGQRVGHLIGTLVQLPVAGIDRPPGNSGRGRVRVDHRIEKSKYVPGTIHVHPPVQADTATPGHSGQPHRAPFRNSTTSTVCSRIIRSNTSRWFLT